ncbi:hypothetical protein PPUJ21368_28830 [Pseudomonas putida]|nr:hypothetical protein PPUJ21368_28830 [Pseudomonas putida]
MADALAVLQYHGIHCADATGFVRQFVEQWQDRLFEWVSDVQPGEACVLRGVEQARQGAVLQLQLVGINQPVQVAQGLGVAFVFVQCRGARQLDAAADQAGEDGVLAHAVRSWNISAKWLRAMR